MGITLFWDNQPDNPARLFAYLFFHCFRNVINSQKTNKAQHNRPIFHFP